MSRRRAHGFTLIELLTVLAVVAIFATLAAPAMGGLGALVKVRSAATDLQMSFLYARSEAIKRGSNVSIVPNGGDFAAGWTVQGGGATLQTEPPLSGVDQAVGPAVAYRLDGRLATTAPVDIRFKAAAFPSVAMRCVLAELSGKPYVKIDTNGNPSDGCN
jgi:type IV fimbrial biogenesis protein FimT